MEKQLTVRKYASCAHQYASEKLSKEENLKIYGEDYSDQGMGHNLVIDATFLYSGDQVPKVQAEKAMQGTFADLDHHFLNKDLSEFQDQVPTLENISLYCFNKIKAQSSKELDLKKVKVQEGDNLWVITLGEGKSYLTKRYIINALHKHFIPEASDEENQRLFGACSRVHGHEYQLEISIQGPIDPITGLLIQRKKMDKIVKETILIPYHKKYLNDILGNVSGEILLEHFHKKLRPAFSADLYCGLKLRETRKNSFELGPKELF